GLGNVTVTQATPVWRATFAGTLASSNVGMISGTDVDMASGDATNGTVTNTVIGVDNVNEVQDLTVTGTPSGGDTIISFGGSSSPAVLFDVTAAQMETHLEAMDSIPQGEATCSGGPWPGSVIQVTFSGSLAGIQALMTNVDSFTGGSSPELTITENTPGVDAVAEVQTIRINDSVTGGTFALTHDGDETAPIVYNATAAAIQAALLASPTSEVVTVTGGPGPGTDWIVTWDTAGSVPDTTVTDANLTGGVATDVSVQVITAGSSGTETTSITVTPVLVAATVAATGTVTFGGRKLEIKIGEGNLTYTENKPREYMRDRGALDTVRNADEEPVDVSFDFVWDSITAVGGSAIPTVEDTLKQSGEASEWLSTSSDACEPYCVNIEVFHDPGCGGENTELVELEEFRYETLEHNISDAQISCTGKSNKVEPTVTRGS
ncbi:hypothetical protein LCGC14_2450700, partial [marine sediment metagenome]